jgi:RNA polymerase sigma factor (sigma-70 family)
MAASSSHPLLQYLRRLSCGKAGDAALDDMQLLTRFLASRDESAFTTLVQRYGAMVWGLCVRCLGNTPEAEDAFQATFLVLVRKASSLRGPESLGPWLYGVAYRTAWKLQGQRARRAARESPLTEQIAEERAGPMWSDVRHILDEEINRLPTKYRLPVLLCYLQGLSNEEAAQHLGCAKGTVFSRLSRARDLLRRRLIHRGVEVSAGALAAVLAENAVLRAAPSLALREITIRTSLLLAAGTTGQTLSAPLAALVEGVVRSMFLSKVKFVAIVVLAVGIAGAGTGFLVHDTSASPPSSPSLSPVNQDDGRAEAPAPAIVKAAAPAQPNPGNPAPNNVPPARRDLGDILRTDIEYGGLEDARATLSDALDQLSKRYNLNFDINDKAFEKGRPKDAEDVARATIADPKPIPPMRTILSTVLRKILRRVQVDSGATYLIRHDYIEITTEAAVRAELGIPANRPLLTLVWDTLQGVSIAEALRQLADKTSYNIVVDPRTAEKLRTSTGIAELNNVPVDTAVRLLANMAGLSVVQLDNVLYVTTAENATNLREEQEKINAEKTTKTGTADGSRISDAERITKNGTAGGARSIASFLNDKGDLQGPPILQREVYKKARENLNVLMKAAYKSVAEGNVPSETNVRDLRSHLRKIQNLLRDNVGQLTPDEYISADRFVRYVESIITALNDTNAEPTKKPASENRAK